jgi:hypothetical protein
MYSGSRTFCLLMALLAVVTELVSAAFGPEPAKPAALSGAAVSEAAPDHASPATVTAEIPAPLLKAAPVSHTFSTSPLEMRIVAHAPLLRVIANSEADSRRMASLADAHERQLLFVKITLG